MVEVEMESSKTHLFKKPGTRLGWWAVGLAIVFTVLFILASIGFRLIPTDASWRIPFTWSYSFFMVACGLAAMVVGLIAILGRRERSWTVWLALIPGIVTLLFVLSQILLSGT